MDTKVNNELSRIKAMMNYGLQTESKKQYSSVEYNREGADGKMYGIIREGNKYYIKVSKDKTNIVKENFDYIGGFNNRKSNEYSSYANALKQFDLKMLSLKEAYANGKNIVIESWNPDKKENLALESTEKMRKEIMRQRQIMGNASLIKEGKDGCCNCEGGDPFCCDVDAQYNSGKDNQKNECNPKKTDDNSKETCAEVNEAAEPLAWHQDGQDAKGNIADTYMDTSHGTEIGSDSPFDEKPNTNGKEAENGVVEEGESMAMDNGDNQNNPTPGVGEVGDDAPFDDKKGKQLDETIEDFEETEMIDDEPMGDESIEDDFEVESDEEMPMDDEPIDEPAAEGEEALDTYDDLDSDADIDGGSDVESRLSSIEDTLNAIMDKLNAINASDYDDDSLYDDESADYEVEIDDDEESMDEPMDDEMGDSEMPMDDDSEDDEPIVYETKAYKKLMAESKRKRINEENKLDYFGKHPAYQKQVMTLPKNGEDKNQWARDWNDDSVHGDEPFGQQIGDSAPFEIDPKAIENSIAECVRKILGQRMK